MPKGCHVTISDKYYEANQEYCRRFCEESGIHCDGPEEPAGCTMCIKSNYGILHRKVRLGPCQENPPEPWISEDECVPKEIVVVAGDLTVTEDTCLTCIAIETHPCYEEYQDYKYQIWNTHFYVGRFICCRCPNG